MIGPVPPHDNTISVHSNRAESLALEVVGAGVVYEYDEVLDPPADPWPPSVYFGT